VPLLFFEVPKFGEPVNPASLGSRLPGFFFSTFKTL